MPILGNREFISNEKSNNQEDWKRSIEGKILEYVGSKEDRGISANELNHELGKEIKLTSTLDDYETAITETLDRLVAENRLTEIPSPVDGEVLYVITV